jgi:single-stranded-DNA-specific exonuclease
VAPAAPSDGIPVSGARRIVRRTLDAVAHDLPPDLHPVLQRLYLTRRLTSAAELARGLDRLEPPQGLLGIDAAVTLLEDALRYVRRILIVADFDADGATSCALAVRALRTLGAARVDYVVPNRFEYGYGLTPEIVAVAAEHRPELLITVDNGISSLDGVAAARARGMRVLITDHHLPGAVLPAADAIVNPNQPGDRFASKHLAGVGVIFYVMLALRARLRERGWFDERNVAEPNLAQWLDLVALGTVADVVPLDRNNRILVAQGLARINRGQACAGIRALLAVAGRAPGHLSATDLGFVLGPRLNAAGRLTDMSLGIACLLSDDPAAAQEMAGRLDRLNRERRAIEAGMQAQALGLLDALHLDGELPRGLCLYDPAWHQGVIGILAARIKERVHRPVIAFAPAGDGSLKGSARSVPGVHVRDVLDAVAARHPALLQKFGGHAMAAGLSLDADKLPAFSAAFADEVGRHLGAEALHGQLTSDGELAAGDLDLGLAELLRTAGPWGQGFPEPLFDGEFEVLAARVVGDKHLKLQLRHPEGRTLDAIAFNQATGRELCGRRVRVAYRLDVNEYQGARAVQLVAVEIQDPDAG